MSEFVYQKLVLNGSQSRKETLDGREHLVVPLVMMTPGVRTANRGKLLYTEEETAKYPDNWNHQPIVIDHPELNGQPVSARTPQMVDSRKCGYVFNAAYKSGQTGEAWLDIEKTNRIDERVIKSVESGETLEVSAGYVMDIETNNGEHGGEKYDGIARNLRPDHLAILPDKKGACDTKKGCGCGTGLVINEEVKALIADEVKLVVANTQKEITVAVNQNVDNYIKDIIAANIGYEEGDRDAMKAMPEPMLKKIHDKLPKPDAKVNNETPPPAPPAPPAPPPQGQMTPEQWLVANNAPPILHQLFQGAIAHRDSLVANVLSNPINKLSEQTLRSMSIPDLQGLQSMLAAQSTVTVSNGSGWGMYGGQSVPVQNAAAEQQPLAPINPFEVQAK